MSDITIPGVTSQFNTAKLIEGLMEAERIPVKRLEEQVSTYKKQQRMWMDVSRRLSNVQESAHTLFGFQNPFMNRIARSSNEAVLTATATRDAQEREQSIKVIQIARADRFLSTSLPMDIEVPPGLYRFTVGEEEVRFTFNGGKLGNFIERLNKRGTDILQGSIVKNTTESQIVLIESLIPGKPNPLQFHDEALSFALDTGILKEAADTHYTFSLDRDSLKPWSAPLDDSMFNVTENKLTLTPGGELSLPVLKNIPIDDNLILSFNVEIKEIDLAAYDIPEPPPGPDLPGSGTITFEGITVENQKSRIDLPKWSPPPPPRIQRDLNAVFLQSNGEVIPLPPLQTAPFQTVKIRLSDYVDRLNAIKLRNNNSNRNLTFENIRVYDPSSRGEYTPGNALSTAQNALLSLDGIEIERESNDADDIIPGVTVNLHAESDSPVLLNVEPDRDNIKEALITFIGHYNRLLTEIHILTRTDESIVDEIEYFSDDERKNALDRLGTLQGDITLMQLQNRLQTIMMNPYQTSAGRDLSLLAQIGIATDTGTPGTGGLNTTKLRGYLEIDEKQLDAALESKMGSIKELFGNDSDGDLVVDSGIAFLVDNYTKAHVQSGGLIPIKVQNLDGRIARTNKDIDTYNVRLERKEQELKEKYAMMEGALVDLKRTSTAIDNFSSNNRNSR